MKRILVILSAMILIMSCGQQAKDNELVLTFVNNDLRKEIKEYTKDEVLESYDRVTDVEIVDYKLKGKTLVLISNQKITEIKNYAFHFCDIESINIPDSVTEIGEGAFMGCKSLKHFDMPTSLEFIGNTAFAGCELLTSIELPTSVRGIGNAAFADCRSLKYVDMPTSLEFIGDTAFARCELLTSIELPTSVRIIGDKVFADCKSLRTIRLSENTKYEDSSFDGIPNEFEIIKY